MANKITPITQPVPETAEGAVNVVRKALDAVKVQFEVPNSARDFVKDGAISAKARVADIHAGAEKAVDAFANALNKSIGVSADVNRRLLQAAREDAIAALEAVEKVAGAKSLGEAFQLYADYLRKRGEVGVERAKAVANYAASQTVPGLNAKREAAPLAA